ncbi:MAG TPA: hypothetical protein VFF69_08315 [Phycisphaerales bacterium]|nr:hypothetical protein [Phycisphaerales bacterium]
MTDVFRPSEVVRNDARRRREESRARWKLGVYTALVIGASGATIVMTNIWADLPPAKVVSQCVRFVLTCGLMWWLWRGSPAAKWIAVVLLGSAGVLGAGIGLLLMAARAAGKLDAAPGAPELFAVMQSTYLPFALRLALPSAVSRYLRRRRERAAALRTR